MKEMEYSKRKGNGNSFRYLKLDDLICQELTIMVEIVFSFYINSFSGWYLSPICIKQNKCLNISFAMVWSSMYVLLISGEVIHCPHFCKYATDPMPKHNLAVDLAEQCRVIKVMRPLKSLQLCADAWKLSFIV